MDDLFSRFGLSKIESTAFLELVCLGASPVSIWAKHARINRSSMYVILARLVKIGLVTTFTHKGIQHVQAIPMVELRALINDKEDSIAQTRVILEKHLPELLKLEKTHGITPKVMFYEGKRRVEAMYEEVLKEKSFQAFFHPGRVKTMMPEYFHKIPQTLKAHNGRAQELLVNCPEAQEYKKLYSSPRHQIIILPRNITFSSDTIITSQKIFLIGYSTENVVGTEIWNTELAQTQLVIFDQLWNSFTSKDIKARS